ncbi:MAG: hypothetical protein M0D55_11555 [Elusimicrobiota bacterium]|nr:MAG: hypothetical protein M0D55_11555 [Elusimicrobiota bacterium]
MSPSQVFYRTNKAHALEKCLSGIESVLDATDDCAVAQNWRIDHRVDMRREGHLLTNLQRPLLANSIKSAYTSYYRSWVGCTERTPVYIAPDNTGNQIGRLPPQLLTHVISLNNPALMEALDEFSGRFMGIRRGSDWSNWLDKEITDQSNDDEFLKDILNSWNQWLQKSGTPKRPRWVSFSRSLGDALADPAWPDRIADALGLAHIGHNEWIMLVEFPVEHAVNLHRPTSIEAGWYWAHFPSPRDYSGG